VGMMFPDNLAYRNKIFELVKSEFPDKSNGRICDIAEDMYEYYKAWVRCRKDVRDESDAAAMSIHQLKSSVKQPLFNCYTCLYPDDVMEKISIIDSCIEDIRSALYQNNDLTNFETELKRELRNIKRIEGLS
jgi:hypothetical protein